MIVLQMLVRRDSEGGEDMPFSGKGGPDAEVVDDVAFHDVVTAYQEEMEKKQPNKVACSVS